MEKLTRKQSEVLTVIKKYIAEHGYSPSVREVCDVMGLSSTATVFVHMRHLMRKGYIRQVDNKFRTLEVLVPNEFIEKRKDIVSIPFLNKNTYLKPREIIKYPDETLALPSYILPKRQEVFALKCRDNRMKNVGIFEKDIVIAKKCSTAKNGDIVVTYDNKGNILLNTFYKEKGHFRLQPENNDMLPIILDEVNILGVLISLYRKF